MWEPRRKCVHQVMNFDGSFMNVHDQFVPCSSNILPTVHEQAFMNCSSALPSPGFYPEIMGFFWDFFFRKSISGFFFDF